MRKEYFVNDEASYPNPSDIHPFLDHSLLSPPLFLPLVCFFRVVLLLVLNHVLFLAPFNPHCYYPFSWTLSLVPFFISSFLLLPVCFFSGYFCVRLLVLTHVLFNPHWPELTHQAKSEWQGQFWSAGWWVESAAYKETRKGAKVRKGTRGRRKVENLCWKMLFGEFFCRP